MNEDKFDGLMDQLNAERAKVDVSNIDFSVRELVRMYEDGELEIDPSYQRMYRWSAETASTFVESVFLGLPVPPIFVATNDDFTWEVVDGLQRVSTLILFMSDDEEIRAQIRHEDPMVLSGLEKLTQLNGCSFFDLPAAVRRYFTRQPLQVISLTDKSDKKVRFDLFERLNSGSISLTPQEVRTAVYSGRFMDFIRELSSSEDFTSILKLQQVNQGDGTAAEEVLKFYAYKNDQGGFKGAVTKFLNSYLEKASEEFDYKAERELFVETMGFLRSALPAGKFLRSSTHVTPLVQFEGCAVAIARILASGDTPVVPNWEWIEDKILVEASTGATNTRKKLASRIDRATVIFSGER
ncbi:DUF262 domain-containing protein [Corynebacterium variabile]|uniref:DUF262 domain-containing protein n=1 Tax=Corynebacterium variabile TaxID=1727 RepID=UPI003FD10EBE